MFRKALTSIIMRFMIVKGERSLCDLERSICNPENENLRLLKKIIKKNACSEFGTLHNFSKIRSLEDFRSAVPLSSYEDYEPYINRLKNGENKLLTVEPVIGFSRTSGSSGVPKYIPATNSSLRAYTKYTWCRALALAVRKSKIEGDSYKPGRGLYTSPAMNKFLPNGIPCSNIAEIGARKFGFIYRYILALPTGKLFDMNDGDCLYNIYRYALEDEDISFIFSVFLSINVAQLAYLQENWQLLVNDIEKGIISDCVNMPAELRASLQKTLRPMPKRALYLRKQFEQGFDSTILKRIWPNLILICGIGNASFQGSTKAVRAYADNVSFDFSIYGASEGLIAACYRLENTDMQLLTDSCFYEFIREDTPNASPITIGQLELGGRYEVVITNQSGLYRYRLKDIVEVVGFRGACPLVNFSYRRGQLLNLSGEKFSEEDARNTVAIFENETNIKISHWIFYADESVAPARYAFLIECDAELPFDSPAIVEEIIGRQCKRYPEQKAKHYISDLIIQRQVPGTHDAWRENCASRGAFAAQVKPVHTLDNDAKRDFFLNRII